MSIRRHPLSPSTAAPGLRPDLELADRLAASAAHCGPFTPASGGTAASGGTDGGAAAGRLARRFYERLFARVPAIRGMFSADLTKQSEKLSQTLEHVVLNMRNADGLTKDLKELGERHVGYGAKPEHYLVVIDELVGAMVDVGSPAFTAEDAADWRIALRIISERMIGGPLP